MSARAVGVGVVAGVAAASAVFIIYDTSLASRVARLLGLPPHAADASADAVPSTAEASADAVPSTADASADAVPSAADASSTASSAAAPAAASSAADDVDPLQGLLLQARRLQTQRQNSAASATERQRSSSLSTPAGLENVAREWRLEKWLDGLAPQRLPGSELDDPGGALAAVLASAVRGQLHAAAGGEKVNELDFLHALGSKHLTPAAKRALVRRLLDGGGAIDALTEAVCAGAESLVNAGASTGGELHEKFIAMGDDSVFKMSFASDAYFYKGLEVRATAMPPHAPRSDNAVPTARRASSGRRTRCWARRSNASTARRRTRGSRSRRSTTRSRRAPSGSGGSSPTPSPGWRSSSSPSTRASRRGATSGGR